MPTQLISPQGRDFVYHKVINSMSDGFSLVELICSESGEPQDYLWLEVNQAFSVQTGLEGVVGHRASERLAVVNNEMLRTLRETVVTGEPRRVTVWSAGLRRWIDSSTICMGAAGARTVTMIVRDVTPERRLREEIEKRRALAEDAAKLAEQKKCWLQATLRGMPVPIYCADANGVVTAENALAQAQWGLGDRAAVPRFEQWRGWWPPGSSREGQPVAPHEWPLARVLRGENHVQEMIAIDVRRQRRYVFITASAIRDKNDQIIGAVAASLDMTDQIQAQATLTEANRRLEHFLTMLAHELRNPLAPIRSVAHLLMNPGIGAGDLQRCSGILGRQVASMVALVNDLTDASRITRGTMELELVVCDLRQVIDQAVEQLAPNFRHKQQALNVRVPDKPLWVHADPHRLVQVFANLLNNASRYTPEGGSATVAVEVHPGLASVRAHIQDTGIGMSPDFLPRAFDLFSQVRRSTDRHEGGLGFGLPLVKMLVELHGGMVKASSPGEGQGSCFSVELPLIHGPLRSPPGQSSGLH